MSKARAQELIDLGNKLFSAKSDLDSLHQEIAENVYPERADFTTSRQLGAEFATGLMDSFPVLARRELGNAVSAIQRPRNQPWFATTTLNDTRDNTPGNARFLEYLTERQRGGLYNPRTDFVGQSKIYDHDMVTFGNGVMSVEEAPSRQHLFYRVHHLRDCAWLENEINVVDHLHRKDAMTARQMCRKFGDKVLAEPVKRMLKDAPGTPVNLRVIVMPADEYDYVGGDAKNKKGKRLPFVCVYVDADNTKILKEGGLHDFIYVVSRWHRISGFAYAFSPAAMTSLPDARMAQQLARIILEAGEKQVDPPLIARDDAVLNASQQAGSISWIDYEYDEKLGEALRALDIKADMRVGFQMRLDVREMLTRAWFLDKLKLPEPGTQRTAYEVARLIEDHVRNLMPLFEPMEVECSTRILDKTFNALSNMNAFDWSLMPDDLKGADITWTFKNPMQEASTRVLISQFQEVSKIMTEAVQLRQIAQGGPVNVDLMEADAIRGTSAPAKWRKTDEEIAQEQKVMKARQMLAGAAQELAAAGDVAGKVGAGAQQLQAAGMLPAPQQGQAQKALPAPAPQRQLAAPLPEAA